MSKQFILIIAVCVVGLIALFAFTKPKASAPSSNGQPSSHIEGQGSKGVTLVEYGDYECPFCGQYFPIVKQVEAQYNADIYFQFRNLPLSQLHPNAVAGARAAEAASLQGKFWQMHDLLYQNQDPNGQSGWVASQSPLDLYFVPFAEQLGLNVNQFRTDYASSQVNDTITADQSAFSKTGQEEATPTFFLDGKKVSPSATVASFQQLISAEIAAKNK